MLKVSGLTILLAASLPLAAYAKDLGVQGAVFEVKEQSLLEVIQARLLSLGSSGKLGQHQQEIQKRVKNSIENPQPVAGIATATSYSSRSYDPSIIIDEDIKDHKGNIIAPKGKHVNPLDHHAFGGPLVFIKGDDAAQVDWALRQAAGGTHVGIVVVSGQPLHLARVHNRVFYFDQGAILSNKFSIKAVPTRISKKGRVLLIEEFNLGGGG